MPDSPNVLGLSILAEVGIGTAGYLCAKIATLHCAAAVGSVWSMIGVAAIGSLAMYFPIIMIRDLLNYLNVMNQTIKQLLFCAHVVGSFAAGAMLMGVAIKPFIVCALIGLIILAVLGVVNTSRPTLLRVSNNQHTTFVNTPTIAEQTVDEPSNAIRAL